VREGNVDLQNDQGCGKEEDWDLERWSVEKLWMKTKANLEKESRSPKREFSLYISRVYVRWTRHPKASLSHPPIGPPIPAPKPKSLCFVRRKSA
jgi:hypothetical protein